MRTTITIADDLLAQVKQRAAEQGTTVSHVIEDSVRAAMLRRPEDATEPFRVRGFSTGGYQPGVDLDDNAALLDHMERTT